MLPYIRCCLINIETLSIEEYNSSMLQMEEFLLHKNLIYREILLVGLSSSKLFHKLAIIVIHLFYVAELVLPYVASHVIFPSLIVLLYALS